MDETELAESINRNLELTIMPTEACNFRCVYCFEDFKIGRMSPETLEGLRNYLSRRMPELASLNISWFGGEPLLAYDIMTNVMEYAHAVAKAVNPSLKIRSEATTNGFFLTIERLEYLTELGVSNYQISFDGDREEHNKLRVMADGRPTFDVIWKNLLIAHQSDLEFSIKIRLHVNRDNIASMEKMLRRIRDEIGADRRFELFIRPLSKLGGANDATLPIMEETSAVSRLISLAKGYNLSVTGDDPTYICYAAKPYAYVIRADGSISKCTVELYSSHNSIGRLLRDGTMALENDKILGWSRGIFSGDMEELACPAKNFPKESLNKAGATKLRVLQG